MNIVVVGNCQIRPIASWLCKYSSDVNITKLAIVHLLSDADESEYLPFFEKADLILTQCISETYPCKFLRTKVLKDRFEEKIITILNLFFEGYTPDWRYIRVPGKGTLNGPMGAYHNSIILDSWFKEKLIPDTIELINSKAFNQFFFQKHLWTL